MVGSSRDLKLCAEVEETGTRCHISEDDILASFGYKQEMHKTMSTVSNFSIAFGCCSILSGLSPMWGDAMQSGGSVAIIYGWILVSIFTFGVGLSLAEICSAYPVTGGLYVWVSRLAPPEWVPIACWLTGWFAITSADLGLAQFLSSVIGIKNPDYDAGIYWQYGIFLVIVFIHGMINSVSVKYNGFFNQTSLYWHLIGTLLIIIVALVMTPNKSSAKWVFTDFQNETGFSSNGYVFLIGLLQSQYTLSGFDSAAHMSEETRDAARSAPRGILYAIGVAALVGLAFMLSVNFCVQDFDAQVVNAKISPQMTQVFLDGVGYKWTIVFTVIIMGAMFFSGSALTLGSSRMVYAFARDGAMPFSSWLSYVNPRTKTPVYAVWANVIFAAIVGLLYIVNTTAFNAIVSINTIASSLAYFIPIALRLTTARKSFQKGPFNLGPFSNIINLVSCFWILFTSVLFLCPTEYPVTASNMNYACAPLVFVLGGSIGYYHFRARKWFTGPGRSLEPDPQIDGPAVTEEYFSGDYSPDKVTSYARHADGENLHHRRGSVGDDENKL
ncbi:amino acid permease-domain-containing protein [Phycomyces blakesleeanus]|uniref:Amino acid permease-domain-containing protein n=1 Tax=Phycomyces blakesleeanus TaxID=4837 RepID=A0ABR3B8U0_PHYBL